MRIGLVDLDTSHPEHFVPLLREMGHEVLSVWDGGDVNPSGYAQKFAATHGIPHVETSLEEMLARVDCAILHGCDWDTHLAKAEIFLSQGKAVMIDKPIAGNADDLSRIVAWRECGARVAGGSALRYCDEVADWKMNHPGRTPHTVLCGCAVDEFNYGIHAFALLIAWLGPDVVSVRHMGECGQRRIELQFARGEIGVVVIGKAASWHPFYSTVITDDEPFHIRIDPNGLYRALLQRVMPTLESTNGSDLIPARQLVLPELCALAAKQSWCQDNRVVRLDEISPKTRFDGSAFARAYRALKGG